MSILRVTCIGAIEPNLAFGVAQLRESWHIDPTALRHGDPTSGRPDTILRIGDEQVVKARPLRLDPGVAVQYLQRQLATEQRLRVHLPDKTWFLVETEDGQLAVNMASRVLCLAEARDGNQDLRDSGLVEEMWRTCLLAASQHGVRLDEGLPNYGVDGMGRLFYLDDELYPWDGFTPLVQSIGVLIRQMHWLDIEEWGRLGAFLRNAIFAEFNDRHLIEVVAKQLSDIFFPNRKMQNCMTAFIGAFDVEMRLKQANILRIRSRRFAVLGDIHANGPALDAVFGELDCEGVKDGLVLGDVVGYGPHPARCIDMLRERNFHVIKGNHDHAVSTDDDSQGFSKDAWAVVGWTRTILSREYRDWLAALPAFLHKDDWMAVHGSPMDKFFFYGYVYEMTYEDNLDHMESHGLRMCFHGHTHRFGVYHDRHGFRSFSREYVQALADYRRSLICPGSVGQPRDGAQGAQYAIMDMESGQIEFRCAAYDVDLTVSDMRRYEFPDRLITRLPGGR